MLFIIRAISAVRQQKHLHVGVPSTNRHWFFGNAKYYSGNESGLCREFDLMRTYNKCYQKWFGPFKCLVMSYHPDIVKPLLSSNEPKQEFGHRYLIPWIGKGLLTSNGSKWKRNRRLLTPLFHFHSLQRYLPCINDAATKMMQKWKTTGMTGPRVEMFRDISVMSLDSLLRCMFTKDSGCESGENLMYLNAVKCLTNEIVRRMHNPLYHFDFLYFLTSHGKNYKAALKIAHDFTENAIQERIKDRAGDCGDAPEPDFLDVLLMAKDENGIGLSHKEIRDELDTFVFEGHDTVTSGISWALYNLAIHPDQQEICRNEVINVLAGRNRVEWQHLPKLQYLTKFIKESMRIYSPVVQIGRQMSKPMFFSRGFESADYPKSSHSNIARGDCAKTFPPNSGIAVRISMLHRNPVIWKNPDLFDPERFSPENSSQRPPHAYVPFSTGPRNCIGQNFAMNEMKAVLAMALSMFKFAVDVSSPKPEMELAVILRSKTGIHLLVEEV